MTEFTVRKIEVSSNVAYAVYIVPANLKWKPWSAYFMLLFLSFFF